MTKPRHLHVLAGTLRPSRDRGPGIALPLVTATPPAPNWLPSIRAVEQWNLLAPELIEHGLLTSASLMSFGQLCALGGTLADMWASHKVPTGHLIAQHTALCVQFGLMPLAQSKLHPATPDKPNRFAPHSLKTRARR